ncbi:MAG: CcmD family protein [Roseivirga sp.]|jgi:CcmD family protein
MKKILILLFLSFCLTSVAQKGQYEITNEDYDNSTIEMADTMRSNGKIYVVVAVVMIIFIGLLGYTISIDRKISKLEKEVFKENINS